MLGIIFLILRILLAIALFLFLAWAFYLIWRDLKRHAQVSITTQIPTLSLSPTTDLAQQSYRFKSAVITVGRDPACECHLNDKTISGQHARLSYQMTQWWVEDLQSTNGTSLNQQPVANPMVLASGDELRFGQLTFYVSIEETG
jgi:pSer/pThr/pTyr-binding forkhead associated (FHA) protein